MQIGFGWSVDIFCVVLGFFGERSLRVPAQAGAAAGFPSAGAGCGRGVKVPAGSVGSALG